MRKTYVIDTNVIVSDPYAIETFEGNDVILPSIVLEELDNLKSSKRKTAQTKSDARKASQNINRYLSCETDKDGFYLLPKDIRLKVDFNGYGKVFELFDADTLNAKSDNKVLAITKENNAILVTNDINLQAKAKAIKARVESYKNIEVDLEQLLTQEYIELSYEEIEQMKEKKFIIKDGVKNGHYYLSNAFLLKCTNSEGRLVKVIEENIYFEKQDFQTIKPKNAEQKFFLDALFDRDREVVVNFGQAGSGKTILSLANAIHEVIDKERYDEIIIVKPPVQLLNEDRLGFMPGDLFDKMTPYLRGILSALKKICKEDMAFINMMGNKVGIKEAKSSEDILKILIKSGYLRIAPIDTIKGETFDNAYIIVDEAQDLTYKEAKALMTRIGENSKIIVIGDLDQISIPYTNFRNSGISIIANTFDNNDIASIVRMKSVQRGRVAEIAVQNM